MSQSYLEGILHEYQLAAGAVDQIKRDRVTLEKFMKSHYGSNVHSVLYSGSYDKGTAISLKYDLDLVFHFNRNSFGTLREMYDSVYQTLKSGFNVRKQNVSLGVDFSGRTVDVVPARIFDSSTRDANLYLRDTDSSIQTNINKHFEYVSKSGCRPIIKLMKVWKHRHGVDFKSFALELFVIQTLRGEEKSNYGRCVLKVLDALGHKLRSVRLLDPANSNNNLMDHMAPGQITNIENRARASRKEQYWKNVIW